MRAILVFVFAAPLCSHAQLWEGLGSGFNEYPISIYADEVSDRLLAGGPFVYAHNEPADSLVVLGMAAWDGEEWDSLSTRVQSWSGEFWICGQTYWFFRNQNTLYACGAWLFEVGDTVNSSIARLNENDQRWEALECVNPDFGGMSTLIPTEADTMFLTGYRGSMCEEPLSCVYTYAAGEIEPWSPYLNDWPGAPGDYVGYVVPFQGSYYMSGLFTNTQTGEYYGLQRYTAGVWEPVPGFEGYAPIREILVHENRLYIAGFFFEAQGAPGNGVAAFDGSTWDRLGGGIGATQDNPVGNTTMVNDLLFHEHELYVSGRFEYAGGIAAQNIARWNGVQWCSFGSVFEPPNYLKMDVWHDDLYVVGGFDAIDGEPINGIAHWLGGSYVAACGDAIGVAEVDATPMVSLQYGADRGVFEIVCSVQELIQVTIHDAMGRATLSVTRTPSRAVSVDLSGNAPGMYLARCTLQDGRSITLRLVR